MHSGSRIIAMSENLVEATRGQLGMTKTALTQACAVQPSVVASLVQDCDIET